MKIKFELVNTSMSGSGFLNLIILKPNLSKSLKTKFLNIGLLTMIQMFLLKVSHMPY
jgi:hypothetical protein